MRIAHTFLVPGHERQGLYPKEWIYDKHDNPPCTKFKRFDWKKDDDGNWIDPPKEDPVDPNQLIFPFVAEIPIETPK